jgi:TP901 family phage tail tape measure protein
VAGGALIGALRVELASNLAQFQADMGRAADVVKSTSGQFAAVGQKFEQMGSSLKSAGTQMSVAITAPLVGLGAASTKAFLEFEGAMNRVSAALAPTTEEFKQLEAAAIEWGAKTKFSATESAEALGELGKAGFTVAQSIAALPSVLQLATVAQMSLADAATVTADTITQFGLKVEDAARVNDVLTLAAQKSTIDVKQLADSLKYAGPVAAGFGLSIEDTAAVLAEFGNAGIKADMAGTSLRKILTGLANPTKGMRDGMEALGIETLKSADGTFKLADVVDTLRAHGADAATVMQMFGDRAGPGMVALVSKGSAGLRELELSLQNAAGAAQTAERTSMRGLTGAFEEMKGSVETAAVAIGSALAPALTQVAVLVGQVADWVGQTLVPWFKELSPTTQTVALAFAAVVAAVGPLLVVIGGLMTALAPLLPALGAIGGALAALATGPIGWVIAAIALLSAAWYAWGDDIKAVVMPIVDVVVTALAPVVTWLKDVFLAALGLFVAGAKQEINNFLVGWGLFRDAFLAVAGPIWELVKALTDLFLSSFELIIAMHARAAREIVALLTPVLTFLKDAFLKGVEALAPFIRPHIEAVVAIFTFLRDTVLPIVEALVKGVATWLLDKFTGIVKGITDHVKKVAETFRWLKDQVVGHSFVPDMIDLIAREFGRLKPVMVDPTKRAATDVATATRTMGSTVGRDVRAAIDTVARQASRMQPEFTVPVVSSVQAAVDLVAAQVARFQPEIADPLVRDTQALRTRVDGEWSGMSGDMVSRTQSSWSEIAGAFGFGRDTVVGKVAELADVIASKFGNGEGGIGDSAAKLASQLGGMFETIGGIYQAHKSGDLTTLVLSYFEAFGQIVKYGDAWAARMKSIASTVGGWFSALWKGLKWIFTKGGAGGGEDFPTDPDDFGGVGPPGTIPTPGSFPEPAYFVPPGTLQWAQLDDDGRRFGADLSADTLRVSPMEAVIETPVGEPGGEQTIVVELDGYTLTSAVVRRMPNFVRVRTAT